MNKTNEDKKKTCKTRKKTCSPEIQLRGITRELYLNPGIPKP